jgi:hypothetical protein
MVMDGVGTEKDGGKSRHRRGASGSTIGPISVSTRSEKTLIGVVGEEKKA